MVLFIENDTSISAKYFLFNLIWYNGNLKIRFLFISPQNYNKQRTYIDKDNVLLWYYIMYACLYLWLWSYKNKDNNSNNDNDSNKNDDKNNNNG